MQAKSRRINLLMAGFQENTIFERIVNKNFKTFKNTSLIYLVSWPEDEIEPLNIIDNRNPGLEIALL